MLRDEDQHQGGQRESSDRQDAPGGPSAQAGGEPWHDASCHQITEPSGKERNSRQHREIHLAVIRTVAVLEKLR